MKAVDYNFSVNFLKLTHRSIFLSLTVDAQLIASLYGGTHKDVHFYWPNTDWHFETANIY